MSRNLKDTITYGRPKIKSNPFIPCKTGDKRVPRKPKVRGVEWEIMGKTPEFPSPKSNLTKVRVKNSKIKLASSNWGEKGSLGSPRMLSSKVEKYCWWNCGPGLPVLTKFFQKDTCPSWKFFGNYLCRLPEGGCKEKTNQGGKEDRRSQTRLEQTYKTKNKLSRKITNPLTEIAIKLRKIPYLTKLDLLLKLFFS